MNREIPEEIALDGIDVASEAGFPAMKNVYNEIMDIQMFFKQIPKLKYDCTVFIGTAAMGIKKLLPDLLQKAQECGKFILTDSPIEEWSDLKCKMIDLRVDEDLYYLFDFR